jgi:hypothetical protein
MIVNINEKCNRIHQLFNNMKPHHFEKSEISRLGFNNGVYIIFEEGETAHGGKRIVRVGTHRESGNLQKRLNKHRQNSGGSIFRRKVGCAILNKFNPDDPDLRLWFDKKYKLIDSKKLLEIRKAVTKHIVDKTTFVAFYVKGTNKEEKGTQFWEAKIIATIAKCNECSPSENWLGNYLPGQFGEFKQAKTLGLWLSDEANSQPLYDDELEELDREPGTFYAGRLPFGARCTNPPVNAEWQGEGCSVIG